MRSVLKRHELYHKVLTLRAGGLSYNQILRSIEREDGTRLRKSHIHDWVTGRHNPFGSVSNFSDSPTPELTYVVGVAKGDATLDAQQWKHRIRLGVVDKDFAESFNRCISKVLRTQPHSLTWIPSRLQWSVEVCSLLLYRFLNRPLSKLKSTVEHCERCIASFLRGFFDSEGSIYRRSLTVSNTRLRALTYAKQLLGRLGISVTGPHLQRMGGRNVIIKGKTYHANRNQYALYVRTTSLPRFKKVIGFSIARKSDALRAALISN